MKKILGLIAVLVLSVAAFGQTNYGVVASGGALTGGVVGHLKLSGSSTVTAVVINHSTIEVESGTITFQTGTIATGKVQVGGTFLPGGSITVVTANEGTLLNGAFGADTTWIVGFNAGGQHFYRLTSTLVDSLGNVVGAFTLNTTVDPSITCFFAGGETIGSISLSVNVP